MARQSKGHVQPCVFNKLRFGGCLLAQVRQRAVKTTSLWRALSAAGHRVLVLPSGGKDPDRFFNRTDTSHWKYARKALLECGLPEENISDPGLEALHTVDAGLLLRNLN